MSATRTSSAACRAPLDLTLPASEEIDRLSRVWKALGHPVRLKIMHILSASGGSVCACDVEARFDLSQPTISHHLRLLREAGLVMTEQRGSWVHYSVDRRQVAAAAHHLGALGD